MYTTDRLILREWRSTDTENFLRIWNDPRCRAMLTNTYLGPHNKEAVEDDVIKAIFRGSETLFGAAVTLKDGTFLGWTTIRCYNPKNRDGEFGIAILPAFWNKGYGTEVTRFIINHSFRELGLHRVSLHVFEDNTNAIELYKGLGFIEEGRKRKANWTQGKWRDVILMAIVDEEYWAIPGYEAVVMEVQGL